MPFGTGEAGVKPGSPAWGSMKVVTGSSGLRLNGLENNGFLSCMVSVDGVIAGRRDTMAGRW